MWRVLVPDDRLHLIELSDNLTSSAKETSILSEQPARDYRRELLSSGGRQTFT